LGQDQGQELQHPSRFPCLSPCQTTEGHPEQCESFLQSLLQCLLMPPYQGNCLSVIKPSLVSVG